ncbi:hypothetical protein [Flagellimonas baculiformis]|uniref:hypothetical protein n=1 Tax=Flagellimonas baculiformis TaxID=3067310 RepID=UPI00296F7B19|nr:hypothetical protein [Muricauda sp. D6]
MKTLTTILSIPMLLCFVISSYGQKTGPGMMNATIYKTFSLEENGTEKAYNVKIMEHRNYPMSFDESDRKKRDQDRNSKPAMVTKLIAVDSNNDKVYEHYMVLKYERSVTDDFSVVATDKGFAVRVDDRTLNYDVKQGIYFIENKDQDFFSVEEFREIG